MTLETITRPEDRVDCEGLALQPGAVYLIDPKTSALHHRDCQHRRPPRTAAGRIGSVATSAEVADLADALRKAGL